MGLFRDKLLRWVKPIHRRMRDEKIDLFLRLVGTPSFRYRLLDVGGGTGIDGEFLRMYASFAEVVVVNLNISTLETPNGAHIRSISADGCALPFGSQSFDWIFSNAVIEHVGNSTRQRCFADEIRRVAARGYFVATPNKYFPIEPHTLLPFYQFLPSGQQRRLARLSPGYITESVEINLLSSGDLYALFPEACVRKIGLRIFPNSLVAMHRVSSEFLGRS